MIKMVITAIGSVLAIKVRAGPTFLLDLKTTKGILLVIRVIRALIIIATII
jgi:hypothetical protein